MPDYGLVAAEELGPTTPQLAPLYPAMPWAMPGARIIKLAYEVGTDFIRHTLPAGLARSTPPYGTLVVYDVPESPFGPYRMAAQTLACRYRNFARVYVLQAVVDNPVALAAFREVWSYPAAPGTVELTDGDGEVSGVVAAPDGRGAGHVHPDRHPGRRSRAPRDRRRADRPGAAPVLHRRRGARPPRPGQPGLRPARPHPGQVLGQFTSAGDRYPWGAVPVTNLIIAVDTKADLEYAPTDHVLDYFPQT